MIRNNREKMYNPRNGDVIRFRLNENIFGTGWRAQRDFKNGDIVLKFSESDYFDALQLEASEQHTETSYKSMVEEFINQPRPSKGNMVRNDLTKTDLIDEDLDDILFELGFIKKEWYDIQEYPVVVLYEEREGDDFHLEMRLDSPFSLYLEKHY